jgi:hypothetical protein
VDILPRNTSTNGWGFVLPLHWQELMAVLKALSISFRCSILSKIFIETDPKPSRELSSGYVENQGNELSDLFVCTLELALLSFIARALTSLHIVFFSFFLFVGDQCSMFSCRPGFCIVSHVKYFEPWLKMVQIWLLKQNQVR